MKQKELEIVVKIPPRHCHGNEFEYGTLQLRAPLIRPLNI